MNVGEARERKEKNRKELAIKFNNTINNQAAVKELQSFNVLSFVGWWLPAAPFLLSSFSFSYFFSLGAGVSVCAQ